MMEIQTGTWPYSSPKKYLENPRQALGNTVLHSYRTVETHNNVSPVEDGLTHLGVRFMAVSVIGFLIQA